MVEAVAVEDEWRRKGGDGGKEGKEEEEGRRGWGGDWIESFDLFDRLGDIRMCTTSAPESTAATATGERGAIGRRWRVMTDSAPSPSLPKGKALSTIMGDDSWWAPGLVVDILDEGDDDVEEEEEEEEGVEKVAVAGALTIAVTAVAAAAAVTTASDREREAATGSDCDIGSVVCCGEQTFKISIDLTSPQPGSVRLSSSVLSLDCSCTRSLPLLPTPHRRTGSRWPPV